MTDPFGRLRRLLRELKRRNVYKVAATYAVVAFVTLQAARLIFPATTLQGAYDVLVLVAFVGFPLAIVLAWAFEATPEGVRRTPEATGEAAGSSAYQWIGLALVVALAGSVWYLTADGEEEAASEATATTDTATRTTSPTGDTAGLPRLAVLPFQNIAPDTTEDYFAQGIHEEVLNQLSKVSGLGVLSRTTMMEYEDADMTAVEIGRELDVKAILEGTVRRAGDQVRITTQLIDAQRGTHLWSNTYDRRLSVEEIFSIQANIAEQIAGSLETQLAGGERRRIEQAPTDNLTAYEAFLRGRGQVQQFWRTERSHDLLDWASQNWSSFDSGDSERVGFQAAARRLLS